MTVINSPHAPQPIGPYSQARCAGDLVFCSGQIPLNPQTGKLAAEDAAGQARQSLRNLQAVLAAAGLTLADVVKVTVFMVDMQEFAAMNQVYGEFFAAPFPARSTIQVAALPAGARLEIEAIARKQK